LIPSYQPKTDGSYQSARRKNSTDMPASHSVGRARLSSKIVNNPRDFSVEQSPTHAKPRTSRGSILTQHTGLPPRARIAPARKKSRDLK